ncbi:23S rRNA (adenine(2030)-N(6))-methyltransferase RlmJ [Alteromonas sp. C1M14]|nr:23S rRNA (adenine(2030)-N(6))-methyltransferase RlmJ [Alteromonas sp. C1M14]
MLSYKHAFHAGNHADVIKHLCWIGVIDYLKNKNKPFTVFDTHAGAGCYSLNDEQVQKNKEYQSGFDPLANVTPQSQLLQRYIETLVPYWQVQQYAGSPLIGASALRDQDSGHFMELHPSEAQTLAQVIKDTHARGAHVHHRDGLEGLRALTPPKPNRGAVLIDPPYERYDEYKEIETAISGLYKRWNNAQVVLWYPLLSDRAGVKAGASEKLIEGLKDTAKTAFIAELHVACARDDTGMYGSGVMVLNPPWQLDVRMDEALKEVCTILQGQSHHRISWVKTEESQ